MGPASKEKKEFREPVGAPTVSGAVPSEHDEEKSYDAEEQDEEITSIGDLRDLEGHLLPPGMGQRVAGAIVDVMFLETVTFASLFGVFYFLRSWEPPAQEGAWSAKQFVAVAVYFFFRLLYSYGYFGWFYTRRGTSPGKWAVGLQIVDSDTDEKLVGFKRPFLRETVGKLASVLPLMAGYIIAAFRKDRRAFHDLLFKTKVVYRAPK